MPYFTISFIHYLWHSGASFCLYYGLLLRLEKAKELLRSHLHDFCYLTFVLTFVSFKWCFVLFSSLGYSNTPGILYPHPSRCGLSRYEVVEMRRCGELIPDWSGEGYWDQGDVVEVLWVGGWDGLPPGAGMMISSVSVGRRLCLFSAAKAP